MVKLHFKKPGFINFVIIIISTQHYVLIKNEIYFPDVLATFYRQTALMPISAHRLYRPKKKGGSKVIFNYNFKYLLKWLTRYGQTKTDHFLLLINIIIFSLIGAIQKNRKGKNSHYLVLLKKYIFLGSSFVLLCTTNFFQQNTWLVL